MHLTQNALYLFQQAGIEPSQGSAQEVLVRKARSLRDTISRWWGQLEPEATAGVPLAVLELTLVDMARTAVRNHRQVVSRQWVRWRVQWRLRDRAAASQKASGDRFLSSLERLGVLSAKGGYVGFTHPVLLELYFGLGLAMDNTLPKKIAGASRTSLERVQTYEGRSVLARLGLAEPEDLSALLPAVAQANLHIPAWFLHFRDDAREEWGEWLADEILRALGWDQDESCRSQLRCSLAALGSEAAAACRPLLDKRAACLPAIEAAIDLIGLHGTEEDVPRLQRLAAEPDLGKWEISQLRQRLREATEIVNDEENQKRFAREENIEIAKHMGGCLLKIAGKVISKHASHNVHHQPLQLELRVAGGTMDGIGGQLAAAKGSDFYQQQQGLRRLMAKLPGLIEERKAQISEAMPRCTAAAETAIARLSSRTEPERPGDPALGWSLPGQPHARGGSPAPLIELVECSSCGQQGIPASQGSLSSAGWMSFALLLVCCFPLCWLPFLADELKKQVPVCSSCGHQLAPDFPSLRRTPAGPT